MPAENNTPSLLGGTENLPDRLEPNRETKDLCMAPTPHHPHPPLPFTLSPRRPGGEGRVRGAAEPICGAAHLTLPRRRIIPAAPRHPTPG